MKICIPILIAALLLSTAYGGGDGDTPPLKTLRIGIAASLFSGVNLKDAQVTIDVWVANLSRQRGYRAESIVVHDLRSVVKAVEAGAIDVISLPSLDYLEIKDEIPIEPALSGVWEGGRATEEYVLLVHRDSGIEALGELRDRRSIIGTVDDGRIAQMWLDVLLLRAHLPESRDLFRSIRKVDKASQAVLPVFFRQADVCVVTRRAFETMIELNPQVNTDLMIFARSPGYLPRLMCFPKGVDEEVRAFLMDSVPELHMYAEGRQILTLFRVERVDFFRPSYLRSLIALVEEYGDLKARVSGGKGKGDSKADPSER